MKTQTKKHLLKAGILLMLLGAVGEQSFAATYSVIGGTTLTTDQGQVAIGWDSKVIAGSATEGVAISDPRSLNAEAIGQSAIAAGNNSLAVGFSASAIYDEAIAIGHGARAESRHAVVLGSQAKVVNNGTDTDNSSEDAIAIGNASYIFGQHAIAIGQRSTVYAAGTAVGSNESIAIGSDAAVSGSNSIAIGYGARIGEFIEDPDDKTYLKYNGGGATDSIVMGRETKLLGAPSSKVTLIGQNINSKGGVDHLDNSTIVGTNLTIGKDVSDVSSFGNNNTIKAGLNKSVIIGSNNTAGEDEAKLSNILAIGVANDLGTGQLVTANYAQAIGSGNTASGAYSLAYGSTNTVTGKYGQVIGSNSYSYGFGSIAYGLGNTAGLKSDADKADYAQEARFTVAIGTYNSATALRAIAIGAGDMVDHQIASKAYAQAIGYKNKATEKYAIAYGAENEASEVEATAIGSYNKASGQYSIAIGSGESGTKQTASGNYAVALGGQNTSSADYAVSVGYQNQAKEESSIAIGSQNIAAAKNSLAIGGKDGEAAQNAANSEGSIAIGLSNIVNEASKYAQSIGTQNTVTGEKSIAYGFNNTSGSETATNAIAIGTENKAQGDGSQAIGQENTTSNNHAIAYGYANTASGLASIAMGINNTADDTSFAIGTANKTYANNALAMGGLNEVQAKNSMAFGASNTVYSSNPSKGYDEGSQEGAMIQGMSNRIYGSNSIAMGKENTIGIIKTKEVEDDKGKKSTVFDADSSTNSDTTLAFGVKNKAEIGSSNLLAIASNAVNNGEMSFDTVVELLEVYATPDETGEAFKKAAEAIRKGNGTDAEKMQLLAKLMGNSSAAVEGMTAWAGQGLLIGQNNTISATKSMGFGTDNTVEAVGSIAIGGNNTIGKAVTGDGADNKRDFLSMAIGTKNTIEGSLNVSMGIGNATKGTQTISIGSNTITNESTDGVNTGIGLGILNTINSDASVAIGKNNIVDGQADVTDAAGADMGKGYALAFGVDNTNYASSSMAMGGNNVLGGNVTKDSTTGAITKIEASETAKMNSIVLGIQNIVDASSALGIGIANEAEVSDVDLTDTKYDKVAALINSYDWSTTSSATLLGKTKEEIAAGSDAKKLSGGAMMIGQSNTIDAPLGLGFGTENTVSAIGSIALGGNNTVGTAASDNTARDYLSMAIGSGNKIQGSLNVSMGIGNDTKANQTISIGRNTIGTGGLVKAGTTEEGATIYKTTDNTESLQTGIGLGMNNTIQSNYSVAIGGNNFVNGLANVTDATGKDIGNGYALAFGVNNVNYASSSMALGGENTLGTENGTARKNSIVMGISNTVDASSALGVGIANTAEVKDVTLADYAPLSQIINSYDWSTMSQATLVSGGKLTGGAMMIGQSNTVDAPLGLGFGTENKVSAIGSIALGGNNKVGTAVTNDTDARDYLSMAIGSGNKIEGSLNVSMGIKNDTKATQTISIGRNAIGKGLSVSKETTAEGAPIYETTGDTDSLNTGIGLGMNNAIESDYSVAIGGNNYVNGTTDLGSGLGSGYALAFGIQNTNYASSSMVMGGSNTLGNADTQLKQTVVMGMNNNVYTSGSLAIGTGINIAVPTATNGIMLADAEEKAVSGNEVAMGYGIDISENAGQSTAIGGDNTVSAANSVALGYGATTAGTNSVALGAGSATTENQENVVSVGTTSDTRKIVNVTYGTSDHDAAAWGQVVRLKEDGQQAVVLDATGKTTTLFTNDGSVITTFKLKTGEIAEGDTGIVSGDAIYQYIQNYNFSGIVDYDTNYKASRDHWLSTDFDKTFTDKGTDSAAYGYGANAKGNESVAVGAYATADGAGSVALGSDSVATGGNVSFGHTKDDTDPATGKKYGTDLTRKLTNVADGTANTDAATVGQSVAHNQTLVFSKDDNTKTLVDGNGDTVATITVNDLGTSLAADQHISFTDTEDGSPTQSNVIKDADGNALVTFEKGKVELNNKNLVDGGTVYDAIAAKNQKINAKNNQIKANDGETVLATIETYDSTKASDVDQGDTYVTYKDVKNIAGESSIVDFDETYKDGGKDSGKHWLSTDFDNENVTHGDDSTAYGYGANAKGDESTALGKNAVANAQGSVAIGSDSVATETGEVSFGHSKTDTDPATGKPYTEDLKRKLTHVADGTENSDVATYGQTVKSGTVDLSKDGESNVIKNRNGDTLVTFTKGTVADNDTGFVSGDDVYSAIAAKNQEISGTNNVIRDNSGNKIATIKTADPDNPVKDGDSYITENYFYDNIENVVNEYSIVDFDKDYKTSGKHWLSTDFDKTFEKKGEESTAYGYGANAQADNSVAIGAGSIATEANSFSVGSVGSERQIVNVAYGDSNQDAAAYGQILAKQAEGQSYNVSKTNNTVKLKANDGTTLATIDVQFPEYDPEEATDPFVQRSDGDHWIDVKWNEGDGKSVVRGENSVAFGYQANASADNSVAIGYGSKATEENTFSVGSTDNQRRITNVAAGNEVKNGTDAANVGQIAAHGQAITSANNTIKDNNGNVIATIYGLDGSAGGGIVDFDSDYGDGEGKHWLSTDFGNKDNVEHGKDSTAYGYGANAKGDNSTAIGKDAKANGAGSVAIGEGSVANDPNEVSFGNDTTKRKLTNVAEGTNPSDVATYGQTVAAGTVNLSNTKAGDKNQTNVIRNVKGDVLVTIEKGEVAEGNTGFTSGGDVWNAIAAKDQTITADNQTIMANDGKTKLATIGTADDATDKDTPSNYYTTKNYVDNIVKNISGSSIVDYDENYKKSGDHYLSTDFGNEDNVDHGKDSTAYGYGANAKGDNSVALGKDAVAEGKGSVAIGEGSVATKANEVSFGNETTKRKLTNVAEGTVNSDVATYGQTVQKGTVNFSNTTAGDAAQSNVIKNNKGEVLVTIEKGEISKGNTGLTSGGDVYDAIAAKGQTVSFENTTDGATGQTNVIKNNKGEVLATIQKGSITDGDHGLVDGDTVYDYVKDHGGTTLAPDQHISFTDTKDGSKTQSNVIKDADGKTIVTFDKGVVEKDNKNLVDGGTVWNEIASKDQVVSFANTKDGDEGQTNVIKNNKGEVLATIKKGTITDGDDGIISGGDVYDYVKDHTGTTLAEDQKVSFDNTTEGDEGQTNVIKDVDGKTLVTFEKGKVEKDNKNLVDGGTVWNEIAAEDQTISGANNTIKANDGATIATIATAKDPTDQTTSKDSYTTKEYVDTIITTHTGTTLAPDQHISFTDTKDGSKTQSNVIKDADGKTIVTFDKGKVEKGNTNLVDGGTVYDEIAQHNQTLTLNKDNQYSATLKDGANKDIATITLDTSNLGGSGTQLPTDQKVSFDNTDGKDGTDKTNVIKDKDGNTVVEFEKGKVEEGNTGFATGGDVWASSIKPTEINKDQREIENNAGDTLVTFTEGEVAKNNKGFVAGGDVYDAIAAKDQTIDKTNNKIVSNDGTTLATIKTYDSTKTDKENKDSFVTYDEIKDTINHTIAPDQTVSFDNTTDGAKEQTNVIRGDNGDVLVTIKKGEVAKGDTGLVSGGDVYNASVAKNQIIYATTDAREDDPTKQQNVIYDNSGNKLATMAIGTVTENSTGFVSGKEVYGKLVQNYTYTVEYEKVNEDPNDKAAVGTVKVLDNNGDTAFTITGIQTEIGPDLKPYVPYTGDGKTIDIDSNKVISAKTADTLTEGGEKLVTAGTMYKEDREPIAKAGETNIISNQSVGDNLVALDKVIGKMDEGSPDNTDPDKKTYNTINSGDSISENLEAIDTALGETEGLIKLSEDKKQILVGSGDNAAYATSVSFANNRGQARRLTDVADGTELTDAANVGQIAAHNQTLTFTKDVNTQKLVDGNGDTIATIKIDGVGGGTTLPAGQKVSLKDTDGKDPTNVIKDENGNTLVEFEKGKIEKDNTGFVSGGDIYDAIAAKGQTIDGTNNTIKSNDGTTLVTIKTYDPTKSDEENKDAFVTNQYIDQSVTNIVNKNSIVSYDKNYATSDDHWVSTDFGDADVTHGKDSTAYGYGSNAKGDSATAIGRGNIAEADHTTAIGYKNEATGGHSTAVGDENKTSGDKSAAYGYHNEASGDSSTAIGQYSKAEGKDSIAIGDGATAKGEDAIAFGPGATAAEGSTAIGPNSVATDKNEVSFGNDDTNRRLTHVADGTGDHDAATYGQVKAIDERVSTVEQTVGNFDRRISGVEQTSNRGIAGAAALAALHPLEFDPDDKVSFAVGYGHFRSSDAMALGAFYRPNEYVLFSFGGVLGNDDDMLNAGISFAFGRDGTRKHPLGRVEMARRVETLQQENADLNERVSKLERVLHDFAMGQVLPQDKKDKEEEAVAPGMTL